MQVKDSQKDREREVGRENERTCIRNRLLLGQEFGYTADKQIKETSKANANNCTKE